MTALVLRGTGAWRFAFQRRTYRLLGFKSFNRIMYALLDTQHGFIWFRAENVKVV